MLSGSTTSTALAHSVLKITLIGRSYCYHHLHLTDEKIFTIVISYNPHKCQRVNIPTMCTDEENEVQGREVDYPRSPC